MTSIVATCRTTIKSIDHSEGNSIAFEGVNDHRHQGTDCGAYEKSTFGKKVAWDPGCAYKAALRSGPLVPFGIVVNRHEHTETFLVEDVEVWNEHHPRTQHLQLQLNPHALANVHGIRYSTVVAADANGT